MLLTAIRAFIAAAALACTTLGGMAVAGEFWSRLDRVTNVTPLVLASSLLVLALSAVARAGPALIGIAVLGVALPAGLMAPDFTAAARDFTVGFHPPSGTARLKVLTANLWSENRQTSAFLHLVRDEAPDIVVVEEVSGPWTQALSSLAPAYAVVAPLPFAKDCNVAILVRSAYLQRAPQLHFSSDLPQDGSFRKARLSLPAPMGNLLVAGVHASRPPRDGARISDLSAVAIQAARLGRRGIMAGDFNAPPWSKALIALDHSIPLIRRTHMLFSWPAPARRFFRWRLRVPSFAPIDHIYAGRDWSFVEAHRGAQIGSDHVPVIVTFVLAPDSAPKSPH